MPVLMQIFPLLILLVIFGIPIALGVRWIMKRYESIASPNSTELPTRDQFQALVDQLESLGQRLEDLDERHVFLERLLEKPRAAREVEAARTGGGDEIA
ncbi:MAG: hypothetical protein Q8W51_11620 [Candidatus Palauibacterales bacterium]|nr:hypothetical protein [Candidatus Palauibacterales bacterium]